MNAIRWKVHTRYAVGTVAGAHPFTTFLEPFPEGMKIARSIEEKVRKKGGKEIDVISAITKWVYENIKYESDWLNYGQADYFASPRLTLERGRGDCEDMAMLIASMLNSLRIRPKTVYVTVGLYKHIFEPTSYHAWTYVGNGIVCEGTAGYIAIKGTERYNRYHPMFGIHQDYISIFWPIRQTEKALGISNPLSLNIGDVNIDLTPIVAGTAAGVAGAIAGEIIRSVRKK